MRRAKVQALYCTSCEAVIDGSPAFCEVCGRPTPFATHEDKTAWEVAQWRAYSARENGETTTTFRVHAVEGSAGTRSTAAAVIDRLEMQPDDDLAPWQRRLAQREEARARREAEEQARRDAEVLAHHEAESFADEAAEGPAVAEPVERAGAEVVAPQTGPGSAVEAPVEPEPDTECEASPPAEVAQPIGVAPPAEVAQPTEVVSSTDAAPREPANEARPLFSWLFGGGGEERPATFRRCPDCEGADWVLRAGANEDETFRYWCVRCGRSFSTDLRLRHAVKPWLVSAIVVVALALGFVRFA